MGKTFNPIDAKKLKATATTMGKFAERLATAAQMMESEGVTEIWLPWVVKTDFAIALLARISGDIEGEAESALACHKIGATNPRASQRNLSAKENLRRKKRIERSGIVPAKPGRPKKGTK